MTPETMPPKVTIELFGRDGNAFSIIERCSRAAHRAGWTKKQIDAVIDEMTAGDYDHLLQTAMKYFDVE